jgi:hypothetical protein
VSLTVRAYFPRNWTWTAEMGNPDKPAQDDRSEEDTRLPEAAPIPMRLLELAFRLGRELDKHNGTRDTRN